MTRNVDTEIERIRSEIEGVRSARQSEYLKHCLIVEEQRIKMGDAKKRFHITLHQGMHNRSPLYLYTESARKARGPEDVVPTYVLNMEAKLCRSMHHMLLLEMDLSLYHDKCAKLFEWMQKKAHDIEQEKGKVEVQVMNDIWATEEEIATLERVSKEKIQKMEMEMQKLDEKVSGRELKINTSLKHVVTSPRYSQRKSPSPPSCATCHPSLFQRLRATPVS